MREWRDRGPGYDIDKVFLGPGSTYIYKAVVRKGNKVTWWVLRNLQSCACMQCLPAKTCAWW